MSRKYIDINDLIWELFRHFSQTNYLDRDGFDSILNWYVAFTSGGDKETLLALISDYNVTGDSYVLELVLDCLEYFGDEYEDAEEIKETTSAVIDKIIRYYSEFEKLGTIGDWEKKEMLKIIKRCLEIQEEIERWCSY